ncbi:helix-turn-helix domain-containing protein [Rhizobium mongolense]|uniref:helix-turn-helix domain-containing protein n=1 Tax=Rhizobium mongolense TaxID=57676 RepID=UPI0028AB8757|nr:helix-turn-helix domain-containing protein [Rhizobium mongolense]
MGRTQHGRDNGQTWRLLDAHSALSDPNDQRRIIEIAEQHCFNDGTEFSRAFRREFGCSPTDVRSGQKADLPYKPATDLRSGSACCCAGCTAEAGR